MKTINLEIQVPDWVEWIAQDKDGTWFGYEVEPKTGKDIVPGEWIARNHNHIELADSAETSPNWQQSLRKV